MDSHNVSSSNVSDLSHADYAQQSGQAPQTTITAFLAKLWALVNDPTCDDLITWDSSGGSFHVYDQARFSREILPRYFKHNNFASFIRQLNMYGFRKVSSIEHGSLKNEGDDIEFAHPHFLRGQESLLEMIKRRAPDAQQKLGQDGSLGMVSTTLIDPKTGRPMELNRILDDVRNLQSKQTSLNDKLSYMQTENQALWGEIGTLRQKHNKQQQIVSKLMEFLLNFFAGHSNHCQEQSVGHQKSNETISNDAFSSQHPSQGQHHNNNSPLILSEPGASPNTLKRKHAALMHGDEPNKRTTVQQQQQQQQFSHPMNLGRQQSVTINELTDNDPTIWTHGIATSPLIDLVPSPPPSLQNMDDHQQQQPANYPWVPSTNETHHPNAHDLRNLVQQNRNVSSVGNGDKNANGYIPDFILRTDNGSGPQVNVGPTAAADIKTSRASPTKQIPMTTSVQQEHAAVPNIFPTQQTQAHQLVDALTATPNLAASLFPDNQVQQQPKMSLPNDPNNFSVDDITGDVDHIQSSLDNIREFMFDNMPDDATLDDLFGDDHALLSPLLRAVEMSDQTSNLLLPNPQEQKPVAQGNNQNDPLAPSSQSVPTVSDQLLEHLIQESAKVEEQRQAINQLQREKLDLKDKIHVLEQQTTKK